jgi:hypothetical protein
MPGWDDNAATFEMVIVANNLHGDYQLANGYGHSEAKKVLQVTPYLLQHLFVSFLKNLLNQFARWKGTLYINLSGYSQKLW